MGCGIVSLSVFQSISTGARMAIMVSLLISGSSARKVPGSGAVLAQQELCWDSLASGSFLL